MTYTIHPIVMGTKIFDKGMMTFQYGYGEEYTIPIYCWYLEGGDKKILVDTGEMSPVISEDRERRIGGKIYTFEEGLAKYGLKGEDIDIVLHTHLHRDHCENDWKCSNAVFYIHRAEMEHIHSPHPLDHRYQPDFLEDVEENGQIRLIDGDIEIVPGISMLHTPAHTEGGMSVLVDTPKGKVLICGFCTILENLYPPQKVLAFEQEVIVPGTHVDAYRAYDILLQSKKLADYLLPLHEPKWASMETVPA